MKEKIWQRLFVGYCCDDTETQQVIGTIYRSIGYLIDPHTAVAFSALAQYRAGDRDDTPSVVVSTASPFKFCDNVLGALGETNLRAVWMFWISSPRRPACPLPRLWRAARQAGPLPAHRGEGAHGGRGAVHAGVSRWPCTPLGTPTCPWAGQADGCVRRRLDAAMWISCGGFAREAGGHGGAVRRPLLGHEPGGGARRTSPFWTPCPGRKLLMKGNHDYWWTTAAKMASAFFQENGFSTLEMLHNNCRLYGELALCGTRGWFYEEDRGEHSAKIFNRELMRLEASLKAAGEREKFCFLHYPPLYQGYRCQEIIDLLERYGVRRCYYGHLHGGSHRLAMSGQDGRVEYRLVAADYLGFRRKKSCHDEKIMEISEK
ncbi:MAG: hypothetical protein V8S34_04510 [Lawsonibacter sp.]